MNDKLLVIKIIESRKSLRDKELVWHAQISKVIFKTLEQANTGIKEWMNIETSDKSKELSLKL